MALKVVLLKLYEPIGKAGGAGISFRYGCQENCLQSSNAPTLRASAFARRCAVDAVGGALILVLGIFFLKHFVTT